MSRAQHEVVEIVAVSTESWACAAAEAVATAVETVGRLRSAELIAQDVVVEDGAVTGFRVRLDVAFEPSVPQGATGETW